MIMQRRVKGKAKRLERSIFIITLIIITERAEYRIKREAALLRAVRNDWSNV